MSGKRSYCGFVAIAGRSNVGEFTLLNKLSGQKISITPRKAQTTRYRTISIHTERPYQTICTDVPGLHMKEKRAINYLTDKTTSNSIDDIKLVIFVAGGARWIQNDEVVLSRLRDMKTSAILAISKMNNVQDKAELLPHLQFLADQMNFLDIVLISAETGTDVDAIAAIVRRHLPEVIHHFPKDYITDRSQRFIASKIIRKELMRFLGAELSYSVTAEIRRLATNGRSGYDIGDLIPVECKGWKKVVISNKDARIKTISIETRRDIQNMFEAPVRLELWVEVESGWTNSKHALCNLGYVNDL